VGKKVLKSNKKTRFKAGFLSRVTFCLYAVVQFKLNWVSCHVDALNVSRFQCDVRIDVIVAEYAASS
jgi:hypothetical protein